MKIVFAGIIGRYPWGGVTWCGLMYLAGLRRLGHDVYYIEDTGECNYDPEINAIATDPGYALKYIDRALSPYGFGDRWCYVDYKGEHHGMGRTRLEAVCKSADAFIVLSGGCWNWRDHYRTIPLKIFIDSDPAFTQLALAKALRESADSERALWYLDFFRTYDHLFTFGSNIGRDSCDVPSGEFQWKHTWQPVCLDLWAPGAGAVRPGGRWTTIMTWKIESFQDIGGNKDQEFPKILGLAERCGAAGGPEFELAISGPLDLPRSHGWNCIEAFSISSDVERYVKYIAGSRAEFSVAKHTYVESNCGWFSDRTECYLASGKPAVVQETGFSETLPVGEGLFSWRTSDEAFEAIQAVERDYAFHARRAAEIAREHFDAQTVLSRLLSQCD